MKCKKEVLFIGVLLFVFITGIASANIVDLEPLELDTLAPLELDSDIAAIVDGEEISLEQLDQLGNIDQLLMQLYQTNQLFAQLIETTPEGQKLLNEYRKAVLEDVIIEMLINKEIEKSNIIISDDEADDYINLIMLQNNLNEEQLLSILSQQGIFSLEQFKELIKEDLKMQNLLEAKGLFDNIEVDEQEIEMIYNMNRQSFQHPQQVKASHILLETEEEAEDILAKLDEGADFAELAKEYSIEPMAAQSAGDLGFFSRNEMIPEFSEIAFALAIGEISEVVETEFGFHIIKVNDQRDEGVLPLEEVKDNIIYQLEEQEKQRVFGQFLQSLYTEAEVEIKI